MMSYHPYNANYSPPFPVAEISLGTPGEDVFLGPIEALIDTGADATLIPRTYLNQVNAQEVDRAGMRSQWGERRIVSIYSVALKVNNYYFSAMWVVGDELGDEIILGRNILNRLRLLLDGPAGLVQVGEDRGPQR